MKFLRYMLMGCLMLNASILLAPPKKSTKKHEVNPLEVEASAKCKAELLKFVQDFDKRVCSNLINQGMREQLNLIEEILKKYEPQSIKVKITVDTNLCGFAKAAWANRSATPNENIKIDRPNIGVRQTDIVIWAKFGHFIAALKDKHNLTNVLDWPKLLGVEINRETFEFIGIDSLTLENKQDIDKVLSFVNKKEYEERLCRKDVQSILALTLNNVEVLEFDGSSDMSVNNRENLQLYLQAIVMELSAQAQLINKDATLRENIYHAATKISEILATGFTESDAQPADAAEAQETNKRGRGADKEDGSKSKKGGRKE